jgi:NADPH:quinone reductase-like Zn-dependent oxidoreductase
MARTPDNDPRLLNRRDPVCSTSKVNTARALGADEVIDYTEDFTRSGKRYDLILDVAASLSFSSRRRVLEPNGILVGVGAADVAG